MKTASKNRRRETLPVDATAVELSMSALSSANLAPSSQSGVLANELKPFIPRTLDDFGFTPAQYRIVCRVARRGDCFESIQSMAACCKLSVKTVKSVIRTLTNCGVFEKKPRQGQTSIFRLAPYSQWRPPSPRDTPGANRPATQPKGHPGYPVQNTSHKGNPIEGNPVKGEQSPPARKRESWQLLRDEKALKERIEAERESVKPDKAMIESLRGQLSEVKNEIRNFSPTKNDIAKKGKPLSGETCYKMAEENGASQKQLDNLSTPSD